MLFQSILCPVDFSTQSRAALRYATLLTRRFRGRLAVLYVNDPMLVAAASAAYRRNRGFTDRTRQELTHFVKKTVGAAEREPKNIELIVRAGDPADEILREAKRIRADSIVMGTQGLSGIQKAFYGSTTEKVLRNANVPVLAIPPRAKKPA